MIRTAIIAGVLVLGAGVARAEEPIVGNWKTAIGETAEIAPCGNGYCVTIKTGKFSGKQLGTLYGTGGRYTGKITDLMNNKTYDGSGRVSGNSLLLKGCVLAIFCESQTWIRL